MTPSSEPQNPATTALAAAPAWLAPFLANTGKMFGAGFAVTFEHGLQIDPLVPDDELRKGAANVVKASTRMDTCRVFYDRILGLMICEYAARHSCSFAEAVDGLDLVKTMGQKFRSFERLPRMVQRNLPESFELPGLTTSHFEAVSLFSEPESPDDKRKWRGRCHDLLKEASADPAEKGYRWVKDKMRELQKEFGILPKKRLPASLVSSQGLSIADVLLSWSEADFATAGLVRSKVVDKWEAIRAELVERDIIPDGSDPLAFVSVATWLTPTVAADAETVEKEEPKDEGAGLHIVRDDE